MKKLILSWVLFCILLTSSMALEISHNGKALLNIYTLPEESTAKPLTEKEIKSFAKKTYTKLQKTMLAASLYDLTAYIEKICGAKIKIVPANKLSEVTYPAIIIGKLAQQENLKAPGSKTSEGFLFQVTDKAVYILGDSPAGTAFGIYEFLKQLGCSWIMPGTIGEVIPNTRTLKIKAQLSSQVPSFEMRCPQYTSSRKIVSAKENLYYLQWKMRNKLQITRKAHTMQMIGGHTWGLSNGRLCRIKLSIPPEMFVMAHQSDGYFKRQGAQLDISNPKLIDLLEKYIRDIFAKNKWAKDREISINVGPADCIGSSESQAFSRKDPITGFQDKIDLQILLCNQLISRLEKDFPNLYLGFYLYSSHANYSGRYKPHPKVSICIADIPYSRIHGIVEGRSRSRNYYRYILEQLGNLHKEQGNPMQLRSINWNLADNMLPYTKVKIWGEDLPFYHQMGVSGVCTESIKAWSINAPADYIEAQMLWNVKQNWKDILRDYCQKSFGPAAPLMEKYYLDLATRQSNAKYESGSYFALLQIFDRDFVNNNEKLLQKASTAVKNTPLAAERVRIARIPITLLKYFLDFKEAYSSYNFQKAAVIFKKMKECLHKESTRNGMAVSRMAGRYLERFFGNFVKLGKACSTGNNQIIYSFPDKLKVMIDPLDTGESFEYYRADLLDDNYIMVNTFSSTWDAQGLNGMSCGTIWYRIKFFIPKRFCNNKIGLFSGGGDSILKVWNNGRKTGEGVGYLKPFIFDLSKSVKFGQENVLVIKVSRNNRSELGVGGLMLPSFVFAGNNINITAKSKK